MKQKKILCVYGCFSVSHYIKEVENRVFRRNPIFRKTCVYKEHIFTKWWNYYNFAQILHSYLRELSKIT